MATNDQTVVEIDGRRWTVQDSLTLAQLPARVAEIWQKRGIVARHEVRLAERGRRPYVTYERQTEAGRTFDRPWRGTLIVR